MKAIANNLKLMRKRSGLSQLQVAQLLGLKSAGQISNWEQGKRYPPTLNGFKLSIIYNCSLEELYPELAKKIARKMSRLKRIR